MRYSIPGFLERDIIDLSVMRQTSADNEAASSAVPKAVTVPEAEQVSAENKRREKAEDVIFAH